MSFLQIYGIYFGICMVLTGIWFLVTILKEKSKDCYTPQEILDKRLLSLEIEEELRQERWEQFNHEDYKDTLVLETFVEKEEVEDPKPEFRPNFLPLWN